MRGAHDKGLGAALTLVLAAMTPMAAARNPPPETDWQSWNELDVSARIAPGLDVTWVSTVRLSESSANPAVYASGLDFNIRVSDHLVVTPSYYYIAARTATGTWARTRVPILAATPAYTWGRWTYSDRNRFAQVEGTGSDFWLFQNRVRIDCALGKGGTSLFAWNEVSYYSVYRAWNRNRFAAGARIVGRSGVAVDLFYVHQNDTRSSLRRLDGIGMTLELRFR